MSKLLALNSNEIEIRQLIEKWAEAIRNKNIDVILAHHSNGFVMYDVPATD